MAPKFRPQPPAERKRWPSLLAKPLGSWCDGCVLKDLGSGWIREKGPDTSSIMFLLEAPGPEELKSGIPTVGAAGAMLERLLGMIGKDPSRYKIDNAIRCLPPSMELANTSFEHTAVEQCRYKYANISNPNHQVIVTMGAVATKVILKLGKGAAIEDLHGTIHPWQDPYSGTWKLVIPTYHPSHLQRGAHNLIGTVLFDLLLAHEIAEQGWQQDPGVVIEDPPLDWFTRWVDQVVEAHGRAPGRFWISEDIETPDKAGGKSEGQLTPDDLSYKILRVNYSCNPNEGVTVPYQGGYIEQIQRLHEVGKVVADNPLIFCYWNEEYDLRRLSAAGHAIPHVTYDGMGMFHLLQSDVPKGLGAVAPFYSKFGAWKHLANSHPSYYAGVDALQNQRSVYGCAIDLHSQGQWDIFLRHSVQLKKYALKPAEEVGLKIDEPKLDQFIEDMTTHARRLFAEVQSHIPDELRLLKGPLRHKPEGPYSKATEFKRDGETKKKDPGDPLKRELFSKAELIERHEEMEVQVCSVCNAIDIAKTHRCPLSKVAPWADASGKLVAPIVRLGTRPVLRWYWKEPFNPDSRDQVMAYVKLKGHKPGKAKKTHEDTVDRKTLERLYREHEDPVYKSQIDLRAVQKVRGTYGIGMKKRLRNGRVHGRIRTEKSSMQRTSSEDPNLQNIIADKGERKKSLAAGFRNCVVATDQLPQWVNDKVLEDWWERSPLHAKEREYWGSAIDVSPGCRLLELDFAGIEAVLTGWFANDPAYIRLAGLGPHACLALYSMNQPPDLTKPDAELKELFAEVKRTGGPPHDPLLYDRSKRVCHGSAYGLTEYGMAETFSEFFSSRKQAKDLLDIFYNKMAPKIKDFHQSVRMRAHNQHYLGGASHPFKYKHWFWSVLSYRHVTAAEAMRARARGAWVITVNGRDYQVGWGEDSKRAIAFFPQSTAGGILKEVLLSLFTPWSPYYIGDAYYGRTPLRAPIHDSLLMEIPYRVWDRVVERAVYVMQSAIPQLPLNPEWNMGDALRIGVDGKAGSDWGHMEGIELPKEYGDLRVPTVVDDLSMIEDEDDEEIVDSLQTGMELRA